MSSFIAPHGGQLRQISEQFSIPASELIDFSANISPDGPPASVLAALRSSLNTLSMLTAYPDLDQPALKQSIALYAGISPHNIVVANGFVPLLEAALRALHLRSCLLPVPAFAEYRRSLAHAGVQVQPFHLLSDSHFRYAFEAMARTLAGGGHDAVLLANPQNPSGVLASSDQLRAFLQSCARQNVTVLLDEAFIDYAPAHSLTAEVERLPNLIAFRSVTKFFAIPGLRVAYAAANPRTAGAVQEWIAPWPITSLAACAASAALADRDYAEPGRLLNEQRRARLQAGLESAGLRTYPSAANFLLFQLPGGSSAYRFWQRMVCEHRLVLRNCSNYEALPPGHLRACVHAEAHNERLIAAAAACMEESTPRVECGSERMMLEKRRI
jgi:threonine-phosphate decarboxylase